MGLDSTTQKAGNRFEFCFETEKIDAVFQELQENGIELLHPLHEGPWGQRTVRFVDPDLHPVEIGETLKTSTPLETVRALLDDSSA